MALFFGNLVAEEKSPISGLETMSARPFVYGWHSLVSIHIIIYRMIRFTLQLKKYGNKKQKIMEYL